MGMPSRDGATARRPGVAEGGTGAEGRGMCIVGLDLAWGDKRPDGYCVLRVEGGVGRTVDVGLVRGDEALVGLIRRHVGDGPGFLAMDGPVICINDAGARPVDRLTHVHFGRFKSGCHPVNRRLCPRPLRVSARLGELGFVAGWTGTRCLAEVYPHPAMVRMFGIPRIVKYKKGSVVERRREFRRLQELLRRCLKKRFPRLAIDAETKSLLAQRWSKPVEDRTDALFCALIGLWHWMHRGKRSEVIGDLKTGFILLPEKNKKKIGDSR